MRLIEVLPDYYDDNETMQEIQGNLSQESDNLEDDLANTLKEIYWTSATGKGLLSRHERIFGIIPDAGKSDRYRREKISAKAAGAATTLVALIRNIAESYTNAAVEIKEDNPRYRATVRFTGTSGIPGNIKDIKESIEEAIPCHIRILYEYIFNTYGAVGTFTHEQLAAFTHYKIRNGHLKTRIMEMGTYQHIELGQLTHDQITKGDLPNGN